MINTRYNTTPTDNMIGSVTKSGEEGEYDWGQTQKSSDDSIQNLKAELYKRLNDYKRLNEKKLPDEKAKIIQKAFRKRNNKTQKKEKKRKKSPSLSSDDEVADISETRGFTPIGMTSKSSSEPSLYNLDKELVIPKTKRLRSQDDIVRLAEQIDEDSTNNTPSKRLAKDLDKLTFEHYHKQREQRGGNPDKISYLNGRIENIEKQILDLKGLIENIEKQILDLKEKKDSNGRVIEFLDDDSRIPKINGLEREKKILINRKEKLEREKEDLIDRKEKLESELSPYEKKYGKQTDILLENALRDIREHKEKVRELEQRFPELYPPYRGGKKKSRRKLRKSGRKTKRRK